MPTGLRVLNVHDAKAPEGYRDVSLRVLYPCKAAGVAVRLGPYELVVAADADIPADRGKLPLVVFSHGSGGTGLAYRTLAETLTQHGYMVALPEHSGNCRADNSLDGTTTLLKLRPRQLSLVVDAVTTDALLGPRSQRDNVALIGHSIGGYTALVLAGGKPSSDPSPGASKTLTTQADDRVGRVVLLAPATPWFSAAGALRQVKLPVLLFSAELDAITPDFHAKIVRQGVGEECSLMSRTVSGAGHFSFLSPFPPEMASPEFAPSQDPPGFDRLRFQAQLANEIVEFLAAT